MQLALPQGRPRSGASLLRAMSRPYTGWLRASFPRFSRTQRLGSGGRNDRFRRNLVIAGRSGERPFTIRFADLRYRALPALGLLSHELRPRKPPEGQLDRGNGNEGGQGLSEGSRNPLQDAALRQLRPNQEKVCSITQRRGTPYDRRRCSGSIKREAIYTASEDPRYPGPTRAAAGRAGRWRGGCCLPLKGPARASL